MDQWLDWRNNVFLPPYGEVFRPPIFGTKLFRDENVHNEMYAEARKKLNAALDHLEAHLAKGHPYLAGSDVTIADLALVLLVLMLSVVIDEEDLLSSRRHLASWYHDIPKVVPHWNEVNSAFYAWKASRKETKQ